MRKVYICEDSVTGILSAIYDAWKDGMEEGKAGIGFKGNLEQELFCTYSEVIESEKKAVSVEKMIVRHLGMNAYWDIYHAMLSKDTVKGTAILNTMLSAKKLSNSKKIMEHLSHPMVEKVFELSRNVGGEAHALTGFVRFRELESGVLFSEITPKNRILTCIAPHFADRLSVENWMIYDKTHQEVAVHAAHKRWLLMSGEELDLKKTTQTSEKEKEYSKLWKGFCNTIAIEERGNVKCQMQHLPLWYRENMTEFHGK